MVARDMKKAEAAKAKTALSVKDDSVSNRLVAADYSILETCVSESDLIFVAVFEEINIKKDIAQMVSKAMKSDAIACSSLSITTLAEQYPKHRNE